MCRISAVTVDGTMNTSFISASHTHTAPVQTKKSKSELVSVATVVAKRCLECRRCQQSCVFLSDAGKPGDLARAIIEGKKLDVYGCNLCGLCSEICPGKLPVRDMLLFMRRKLVAEKEVSFAPYRRLLAHERIGKSRAFVSYVIPAGCDTVFFPGCHLPGSRPKQTHWLLDQLQKHVENLGVVLDCCLKPSHDLGRQEWFWKNFQTIIRKLRDNNVQRVLTACPSCHWIFRDYGESLVVESVYEVLSKNDAEKVSFPSIYRIHDACTARYEDGMRKAIRKLARRHGAERHASGHSDSAALCCGQGGGAWCVAPELAGRWSAIRVKESEGVPLLTYCGGCSDFLSRKLPTTHILDLMHDPQRAFAGEERISPGLLGYGNRLHFKKRLIGDLSTSRDEKTLLKKSFFFRTILATFLLMLLLVIYWQTG